MREEEEDGERSAALWLGCGTLERMPMMPFLSRLVLEYSLSLTSCRTDKERLGNGQQQHLLRLNPRYNQPTQAKGAKGGESEAESEKEEASREGGKERRAETSCRLNRCSRGAAF